jgi:archaellum component FlaC
MISLDMKKILRAIIQAAIGALLLSAYFPAYAIETAPRISDREIIERLDRLEEGLRRVEDGQKAILREMDKRFEAVDKRFEAVDKRFDEVDKRFNLLVTIFIAMTAAFFGMTAATIGFAIWDRRTMIRPFEDKMKKVEENIAGNSDKIKLLIETLRGLGKTDHKVAEVLKKFNLW